MRMATGDDRANRSGRLAGGSMSLSPRRGAAAVTGACAYARRPESHIPTPARSLMWSVMRIVGDAQVAEDFAHDAYLRVRGAMEAGPIEHIEAFLHQTARNLALDYQRRRRMRCAVELEAEDDDALCDIADNRLSQELAIIEREKFSAFGRALSGLPSRAQQVMILSRIEEWSNRQIAEHLGVSERTVFNDLKTAMAHCRERLARLDPRRRRRFGRSLGLPPRSLFLLEFGQPRRTMQTGSIAWDKGRKKRRRLRANSSTMTRSSTRPSNGSPACAMSRPTRRRRPLSTAGALSARVTPRSTAISKRCGNRPPSDRRRRRFGRIGAMLVGAIGAGRRAAGPCARPRRPLRCSP